MTTHLQNCPSFKSTFIIYFMFSYRQGISQLKNIDEPDDRLPQSPLNDNLGPSFLKADLFSTASAEHQTHHQQEHFDMEMANKGQLCLMECSDGEMQLCLPEDEMAEDGFNLRRAVVEVSTELKKQVEIIKNMPEFKPTSILQSINLLPSSFAYLPPPLDIVAQVKMEDQPPMSPPSSTFHQDEPTSKQVKTRKTKKIERAKKNGEMLGDLFVQKKNTNIPKKLVAILHATIKRQIQSVSMTLKNPDLAEDQRQECEYRLNLLLKTNKRLDRKKKFELGTMDLESFFGGQRTENEMQEQNQQNRRITKKALSQLVYDEVLNNDSIPVQNKFSYLKCLRVLQWRMRKKDGKLATRIQSLS